METKEMLTIQELEQLCQAYMDCRLSRLQEKELELVLLCSDHSSPIVSEVRSLMGLSALMARSKVSTDKTKTRVLKYSGIAACVAVSLCVVYLFIVPHLIEDVGDEIYVCVDGKELKGYVAQSVMNETQEETMSMFQSIISDAEEEQRLSEQYMNTLIE